MSDETSPRVAGAAGAADSPGSPGSPGVAVRAATVADLDAIVEMNAAMARETEGLSLDLDRLRAGVAAGLRDPAKARYFLAYELACEGRGGGLAAGGAGALGQLMLTTEWSDWRAATFWWIQSVYVRAGARRRGVYRALYEHVIQAARATRGAGGEGEVCGVRLYVHHDNAIAQATYRSLGMDRAAYEMFEVDFAIARG